MALKDSTRSGVGIFKGSHHFYKYAMPPASGLAASNYSLLPEKSWSRATGVRAEGVTQQTTLSLTLAFRPGVLRPTANHRRRHDFLSNPKAETGGTCGNHFTTHGLKGFVM
ncbi:MAG: hypothetical protein U5L09_03560 [Bacteroidales bacterium]|nr:hypothetical protein [Bacteroidales bacterium]